MLSGRARVTVAHEVAVTWSCWAGSARTNSATASLSLGGAAAAVTAAAGPSVTSRRTASWSAVSSPFLCRVASSSRASSGSLARPTRSSARRALRLSSAPCAVVTEMTGQQCRREQPVVGRVLCGEDHCRTSSASTAEPRTRRWSARGDAACDPGDVAARGGRPVRQRVAYGDVAISGEPRPGRGLFRVGQVAWDRGADPGRSGVTSPDTAPRRSGPGGQAEVIYLVLEHDPFLLRYSKR